MDKDIFKRYMSGECTQEERALVEQWFDWYKESNPEMSDVDFEVIINSLDERIKPKIKVRKTKALRLWISVAASVLLAGVLLYWNFSQTESFKNQLVVSEVGAPTSSNAMIVLENGSRLSLDDVAAGDTIQAQGFKITKLESGELTYIYDKISESETIYNTLKTETGGLASVKLSDGTKVWLNARAELKYPVQFSGDLREVELRGEGYFEVTEISSQPFVVRGENQTIKVLGTKFNANFTKEKQIALLQGKVTVANEGSTFHSSEVLSYEVEMIENQVFDGVSVYKVEEIERFIDWQQGYFDLNNMNLERLVMKIAEWYGVEVVLESGLPSYKLFGKISRDRSLSDVLELVQQVVPIEYRVEKDIIKIMKTNKQLN